MVDGAARPAARPGSRSSDERGAAAEFWSGRKNAFPASGRISPDYMCMDSTIPRKRLADMLIAIGEMEAKHGLRCVNVFHAGDGNLHPLILFDANDPDQLHRAEAFGAEILELSVAMGGTVTGEHGVGVEKLRRCACSSRRPSASRCWRQARLRSGRPAQPGQGDPDAGALRRVREDARQARPARVSRAAAVLIADGRARVIPPSQAIAERVREAHARAAGRCCIRGGGSKDFYGEAPRGDVLDTRALRGAAGTSRPSSWSPRRPACGSPTSRRCSPSTASAWRSSRRASAPGSTVGGMVAAGLSGPARAAAGAVRDHLLGVTLLGGTRRADALRRPGDQERRRLRRVAPDRRLAGHRSASSSRSR